MDLGVRLVSEAMGGAVEMERLHEYPWVLHLSELKFQKKLLDYNSEMDKVDSKVDSFHKTTRLTIRLKILRSLQNGESLQSIEWGKKPKKFAKFNFSKLYDIIIWPFFFHVLLYFYSSVVMNVILRLKGFKPVYKGSRRCWHLEQSRETANNNTTPICFIHGIGIGLMPYLSLIGKLQKTARPIILLEVSEVSAFRCFDFNKKVSKPRSGAKQRAHSKYHYSLF